MFVKQDRTYDFAKLKEITKVVTRNLNKIIDVNYYPVPEVRSLVHHLIRKIAFKYLDRPSDQICATDQLESACKVWPTPSF